MIMFIWSLLLQKLEKSMQNYIHYLVSETIFKTRTQLTGNGINVKYFTIATVFTTLQLHFI